MDSLVGVGSACTLIHRFERKIDVPKVRAQQWLGTGQLGFVSAFDATDSCGSLLCFDIHAHTDVSNTFNT